MTRIRISRRQSRSSSMSLNIRRVRPGEAGLVLDFVRELAALDLPGIYHVVSSGEGASFETFSVETFRLAGLNTEMLEVVDGDTLGRPAPRPRNSRLRCLLSEAVGLSSLPAWQDGLARFIKHG